MQYGSTFVLNMENNLEGTASPLLYWVKMSNTEKKIWEIAEEGLPDESLFIVEVSIASGKTTKVTVLVDGDNGVDIDICSKLSRHIGNVIEENEIISSAYTLDVGSPGLSTPLKLARQFKSNIGRKLKIKLTNGETVKGKLESADDTNIELLVKGQEEIVKKLEYIEIEWAKVQVSFNNI